jgi:hypothetical protein
MHKLFGLSVLVVFSLFLSLSCDNGSTKSPLLALASGSGAETGGGTDVQGQRPSEDEIVGVLATVTRAIQKVPWGDLQNKLSLDKSSLSGGSSSSSGPAASVATGYTITLYEEAGLKVDAGIADDWSGFILNVILSNFAISPEIPIALSGSLNIFATFTDWTEVKLIMNTLPSAPLSVANIPWIEPTIGMTDVTLYFDWYNLAIVEKTGNMGTLEIMGYSIAFDPSLIAKIMDLLKGVIGTL